MINYKPQDDINVLVEDQLDVNLYDLAQNNDEEYMSKNKMLQQKYDQNFHSHIISTGTVSLVSEDRQKTEINRREIFPPEIS